VGAVAGERPAGDQPLGRLLAMALTAVIDELHERLADAGWPRVRPMWGFVLLALRDRPRNIGEVGELLGVTKQAAAKVVGSLVDEGLVERREDQDDRRAAVLVLTPDGLRFLADAEAAYEAIEAGWAEVAGRRDVAALRRAVSTVLRDRYGPQKPPMRPVL
jgi:DNA-binding MarR family transcriptional regulator